MDSLMLLLTLLDLNIAKSEYHGFIITDTKILSTDKATKGLTLIVCTQQGIAGYFSFPLPHLLLHFIS